MSTKTKMSVGDRYHSWTLTQYHKSEHRAGKRVANAYWTARCDCGTVGTLNVDKVNEDRARKNCGCIPREPKPDAKPERRPVNSVFQLGEDQ